MSEMRENRKRVNVTYDMDTYENLQRIAASQNIEIPELIRRYSQQGINGTLNKDNVDFLTPIIREQLKSILAPAIERIATLQAKTCIQAGAAAYLSAEALASFVPISQQKDFLETYERARKKAIQYARNGMAFEEDAVK